MKVEKRNGTIVDFDRTKIYMAISKAVTSNKFPIDDDEIVKITSQVCDVVNKKETDKIKVEEIQDIVIDALLFNEHYELAKEYIKYRERRKIARDSKIDALELINDYIDGYDLNTLPYDEKADSLDRAGYALANSDDAHAVATLKYGVAGLDKAGNAYGSGDPRYQKAGQIVAAASTDIYDDIVDMFAKQTAKGVPTRGRWLLCSAQGYAEILKSNKAIRQSDLSQEMVNRGVVAMIGGYEVYTTGQLTGTATATGAGSATNILCIAGHPNYCTVVEAFKVEPNFFDGNGDSNVVGGVFLKGRLVFTHEVTQPEAFVELVASAS